MLKVTAKCVAVVWGIILLAALYFAAATITRGVNLETDLLKLLPPGSRERHVEQATEVFLREVSQRVLVLFHGKSFAESSKAAEVFAASLKGTDVFERAEVKQQAGVQSAFRELYFSHRDGLYSESLEKALATKSPAEALAKRVYQVLSNPITGGAGRYLAEDPFFLFSDFLSVMRKAGSGIHVRQGYITTQLDDREYLVFQGVLRENVFDRKFQKRATKEVARAIESTKSAVPGTEVLQFGALQFASEMAGQAENDVYVISIGSILGVIILLLVVFRSPVPLLVTTLTIAGGLATAFCASLLWFDSLHAMALAFGASLIGVCSDYSLHFFAHRSAEPKERSPLVLAAVLPGITLGMCTTALGYLALFSVPFPGLYQMAFFSVVGMLATYLSVALLYQYLPVSPEASTRGRVTLGGNYLRLMEHFWLGKVGRGVLCILVLVAVYGVSHLSVNDNVRELQKPPEHLVKGEARIARAAGGVDKGRFVLHCAESDSKLLAQEGKVRETLDSLVSTEVLKGYQALSRFVPAPETQHLRAARIKQVVQSHRADIESRFVQIGYDPQVLSKALTRIEQEEFEPVTLHHWLESAVSEPLRFLYVPLNRSKRCSLILLQGQIPQALFDTLEFGVEGATTVDLVRDSTRILKIYRESASYSIALCYLLVALALVVRYGLWRGLLALLPPFAACIGTLAVYGLFGIPVTLFSVLANAIVLGLAVDYSIFILEGRHHQQAVLLAILLSGISSILSFGLLGLSAAAVLQSFGLTLFVGVLLALIFAPLLVFVSTNGEE